MHSPAPAPFAPPHCPQPDCDFHVDPKGWRYKRAGFYVRTRPPCRIQRYRCLHCRRAFSTQTFSTTYWLKRPDLQIPILCGEVGGSGHRQIARQHAISHATVQRHVARLGRHALLRHEQRRVNAPTPSHGEPLVLDGLRSFAGGQYWPLEITHLIGARSYHSYDFAVTERRRSGTMTAHQKRRRQRYEATLGRPDPKGLRKDVLALLEASLPETGAVELRSDEEKAYVWALRKLARPGLTHRRTHSKVKRDARNPLFAVNAHHSFLRHSGGNHKRETIAFSKKLSSVIWRHAIFQLWVNEVKLASEREARTTPAMRIGRVGRRLSVAELVGRRLFPDRMRLRKRTLDYYWGRMPSRFLKSEHLHTLKYAF